MNDNLYRRLNGLPMLKRRLKQMGSLLAEHADPTKLGKAVLKVIDKSYDEAVEAYTDVLDDMVQNGKGSVVDAILKQLGKDPRKNIIYVMIGLMTLIQQFMAVLGI